MFDKDRSWTERSIPAASAGAEIFFVARPKFQTNPNSLDDASSVALPAVSLGDGEPGDLPSITVMNHESELVRHYRMVLDHVRRHGHSYNEFSHYFWLRLRLGWGDGAITFPWYDTFHPMQRVFGWLETAADDDLWSDIEQGWELIAIRRGPLFHFREGGFDQGEEYANVALPRDQLLRSISSLRVRMRTIIMRLTAEIGEDYWTQYRYDLRTDLSPELRSIVRSPS